MASKVNTDTESTFSLSQVSVLSRVYLNGQSDTWPIRARFDAKSGFNQVRDALSVETWKAHDWMAQTRATTHRAPPVPVTPHRAVGVLIWQLVESRQHSLGVSPRSTFCA